MTFHAMIDLETLGVSPVATIATIGAVMFDPNETTKPHSRFYEKVELDSCFNMGMLPDASTLKFWAKQPKEVAADVFVSSPRHHISPVLNSLNSWYSHYEVERVWANGTTFDLSLLHMAYHKVGLRAPWHFRHILDVRTLLDAVRRVSGVDVKRMFTSQDPHNALSDASLQASIVQECYRILTNIGKNPSIVGSPRTTTPL